MRHKAGGQEGESFNGKSRVNLIKYITWSSQRINKIIFLKDYYSMTVILHATCYDGYFSFSLTFYSRTQTVWLLQVVSLLPRLFHGTGSLQHAFTCHSLKGIWAASNALVIISKCAMQIHIKISHVYNFSRQTSMSTISGLYVFNVDNWE